MASQRPWKKKHSVLRKVTTVTVVSLFLLALLETGLRLFGFSYIPKPDIRVVFMAADGMIGPNPDTIWTVRPNTKHSFDDYLKQIKNDTIKVARYKRLDASALYKGASRITTINNLGLHNEKDVTLRKPPGTFRVLCMGGSTTFGNSQDRNWTSQLRAQLESALGDDRKVEVLNAGVPGFSSLQALLRYRRTFAPLEADVVVFMSAWNDATIHPGGGRDSEALDRFWKNNRRNQEWFSRLRIVQLARYIRSRPFADTIPGNKPIPNNKTVRRVSVSEYKQNLREAQEAVRARDSRMLICTEPAALSVLDPNGPAARKWAAKGQTAESQKAYNDAAREMARELKVPLADPAAAMPREKLRFFFFEPEIDPIHSVVPGEQLIAELIFAAIQKAGYLPTGGE